MTLFRRLSLTSAVATFLLIGVGGLVRATGSGLGCGNDWPACGGHLVPSMQRLTTVIEYSHRLIAASVIVLTAALVVVSSIALRSQPRLRWCAVGAFTLVLAQAVLGAIVVKLDLQAVSVVAHLALALSLGALLIYTTVLAYAAEGRLGPAVSRSGARLAAIAAGAVFVQLLIGSYVSGREAGLVYPDWPLMDGRLIPPMPGSAFVLQFVHRIVAVAAGLIVAVVVLRFLRARRDLPAAGNWGLAALGLFVAEILIGAGNIWTRLNPAMVTAHLLIGSLIWGALVTMVAVTSPALRRHAHRSPAAEPAPSTDAALEGHRA